MAVRPRTALGVQPLEDRLTPSGTPLDLTARGSAGYVGDAYFKQADAQPTGTGRIDSFLRVQVSGARGAGIQGYNTDARPFEAQNKDANNSPQFTRSVKADEFPVVAINGRAYREFLLDINQKASQPTLSLDELRVYVGTDPNLKGYDPVSRTLGGKAPVYDLDAGGDRYVKLDYRLNPGSGAGDMLLYVPAEKLPAGSNVTLFSRFGDTYAANAGFEEWAPGGSKTATGTGTISGTVFTDADQNGAYDPSVDAPIGGRAVFIDANANGVLDNGEQSVVTGGDGHYLFPPLAAGPGTSYRVVVDGGLSDFEGSIDPTGMFSPLLPNPFTLYPGQNAVVDFAFVGGDGSMN